MSETKEREVKDLVLQLSDLIRGYVADYAEKLEKTSEPKAVTAELLQKWMQMADVLADHASRMKG